ncbi:MAG: hypothetical protein JNL48_02740 [Acidobacteria bacterium]|nr:hypothetical protein [Acidobacteriota bacterium]
MTGRLLRSIAGMAAAWLLSAGVASAQAPVMAQPGVAGNNVTFNWSSTAGATGYRLDYGVAPGSYIGNFTLGAVNTFGVAAPNGIFYVRVVALPGNEASNEITLQVPAPPSAPTGLVVARNGRGVIATWAPGVGGGTPTGYRLIAALSPGGGDFVIPTVSPAFGGGPAPATTLYFRAVAVNAAGQSAPSSEVSIVMPEAGACDPAPPVPLTTFTFSGYVSVSWPAIAGASQYVLSAKLNGVEQGPFGLPPSVTRVAQVAPLGTYELSVKAFTSCGGQSPDNPVTLVNDGAPPPGPRTPDPAPGTLIPSLPGYGAGVVEDLARARPDLVRASCVEFGGNNRFLFEVVKELRKRDTRWGLNIKRCNEGTSQDVVAFNRSALPDEGARTNGRTSERNIFLVDMIGGHCGPNPGAAWDTSTTDKTVAGGACSQWTLIPLLQAGYTP